MEGAKYVAGPSANVLLLDDRPVECVFTDGGRKKLAVPPFPLVAAYDLRL